MARAWGSSGMIFKQSIIGKVDLLLRPTCHTHPLSFNDLTLYFFLGARSRSGWRATTWVTTRPTGLNRWRWSERHLCVFCWPIRWHSRTCSTCTVSCCRVLNLSRGCNSFNNQRRGCFGVSTCCFGYRVGRCHICRSGRDPLRRWRCCRPPCRKRVETLISIGNQECQQKKRQMLPTKKIPSLDYFENRQSRRPSIYEKRPATRPTACEADSLTRTIMLISWTIRQVVRRPARRTLSVLRALGLQGNWSC